MSKRYVPKGILIVLDFLEYGKATRINEEISQLINKNNDKNLYLHVGLIKKGE